MRRILLAALGLLGGLGQVACHSKGPVAPEQIVGSLSLSLSPSTVSLPPGGVVPVEVSLQRAATFTEPVTVTLDGLPNGLSASPLSISGNSGIFNLSASSAAPPVNNAIVSVTATGASGTIAAAGTLAVSVTSTASGFSLSAIPTPPRVITLSRGSTASALVTVTRHNFAGVISVSVSGLAGTGVSADNLSIPGNRGTLVLHAAFNAAPNTLHLTVMGVSDSSSAAAPLEVVVLDPGGLDPNFGAAGPTPGWVVTQLDLIDAGTIVNTTNGLVVAVQPDGKLVVAGNRLLHAVTGRGCGAAHNLDCLALAVTRYNSDGTLDSTFGGPDLDSGVLAPPPPGIAILLEGPFNGPSALLQGVAFTDAGILIATGANNAATAPDTLLRLTWDGMLDPTFNPDVGRPGHAQKTINAKALAVMSDGGIVVAGNEYATTSRAYALARYGSDGTLDQTFGDGGILFNRFDGGLGLPPTATGYGAIFTGQNVKVVGWALIGTTRKVGVMSFDITANGSVDESFNGHGEALVLGPISQSGIAALDLQGNAAIVANILNPTDVALVSFQPDGGLDSSFGDGGVARGHIPLDAGAPSAAGAATFVGKIVVAGVAGTHLLIARYNSDGSPDLAFGQAGTGVIIGVPNLNGSSFTAVTIQADGKIVAVGLNGSNQQLVVRYLGSASEE